MNWDRYSDQPYADMDPVKKRKARLANKPEMVKTLLLGLVFYPLGYLFGTIFQRFFLKRKPFVVQNFFGIGINLDRYPELTPYFIKELNPDTLTVRVPLWEIEKIEEYVEFIKEFQAKDLIVVLMQSRELIENDKILKNAVKTAFEKLFPYTSKFQFGVAINRYKWGYYTTDEYLANLETVQRVKKDFPGLELIGSSVIDFEYLLTIRTLFNFFRYRLDAVASLLYVDRRGAPENNQGGLNLKGKIEFLYFLVKTSFKNSTDKIYITETNWPLKNSGKYAPTSPDECIEESVQSKYLVRYYLLALGTKRVSSVYWHQLISPGFGLIDFREGIRKREAYHAFKTMNGFLNGTKFLRHSIKSDLYQYDFSKNNKKITVQWSLEKREFTQDPKYNYYNITGKLIEENRSILDDSPIYIVEK